MVVPPELPSAAHDCTRFTPKAERSILCRTCGGAFFKHPPKARGFDSVLEMQRAYMNNDELIKWLKHAGKTNIERLNRINKLIADGHELPGCPDLMALEALRQVMRQMVLEDAQGKLCTTCLQPLELAEVKICFECRTAAVMATEGEDVTEKSYRDSEGTPATLFPEHDFD